MLKSITTWLILTIVVKICCAQSINSLCQVSAPIRENTTRIKPCADNPIVCINERPELAYNFCMTYDNDSTISIGFCPYFDLRNYNITKPGYISLPDNISELNDFMCGPMNRKGLVCSECIDGYGPSVTSTKFRCSDCSNAWYGVPLYLLLELVPVTVFYLVLLLFQINLTSAPMIIFILYSNFILLFIRFNFINFDELQVEQKIIAIFYSLWTLDFFRFIVPPFCVAPNLKIIHVLYLQTVSAVFPFVLIGITWLCIKLHSRNFKIVTQPWQLLERVIVKRFNITWTSGRTVIDTFSTFFLLTFSKITLVLLLPLYPSSRVYHLSVVNTKGLPPTDDACLALSDPSISIINVENLPFVIISAFIFLFAILPPVLFLALYPIQRFRALLLKCLPVRYIGPLNIFADKFYRCYRDGLKGGRDMRSLASFYFFIILLSYSLWSIESTQFFLVGTLFGGCSIFIAIVQPYKKKYMSVIDTFILANIAFLSTALDKNIHALPFFRYISVISAIIPALGLFSYIVYRVIFEKPLKKAILLLKQKLPQLKSKILPVCINRRRDGGAQAGNVEQGNAYHNEINDQLPDRIVRPQLYTYR